MPIQQGTQRVKIEETPDAVIVPSAGPPKAAVVWLHGLGADGHDFVPIVPELRLPAEAGIRFVFPHAPVRPVTINGGMPMRAWYDILSLTRDDVQDESGIRASAQLAQDYLEREIAAGVPRGRVVLAGFSQGGAIALHAGLRQPAPLGGVLALSTYLPIHQTVMAELTSAGRSTPIFMCHGEYDPVLPMVMGTNSRDGLRRYGCQVEWRDYPMQHEVCGDEIADVATWLRARLMG